jgi:hypothetical protein
MVATRKRAAVNYVENNADRYVPTDAVGRQHYHLEHIYSTTRHAAHFARRAEDEEEHPSSDSGHESEDEEPVPAPVRVWCHPLACPVLGSALAPYHPVLQGIQ